MKKILRKLTAIFKKKSPTVILNYEVKIYGLTKYLVIYKNGKGVGSTVSNVKTKLSKKDLSNPFVRGILKITICPITGNLLSSEVINEQ